MEENKKSSKLTKIISCVVVVLLVLSLVEIANLNSKIDNLESANSRLNSEINLIRNDINSVYNNVDEKLKKQASILSGVNYDIGEINDDNETVPVSLKIVPKTLTDDMIISVKIGDETTTLTRKGDEFTAKFNVGLFIGYDEYPLVTIKTSAGTQTEYLEDVNLSYRFENYFPTLEARMTMSSRRDSENLNISSTLDIDVHHYGGESPVAFTKITLVEKLNGEEIGREDITDKVTQAEDHYSEEYVKSFKMSGEDELRIYVVAENSLGYTHEVLAGCWMDDKMDAMAEVMTDNEIIYDEDGNVLWQKYIIQD